MNYDRVPLILIKSLFLSISLTYELENNNKNSYFSIIGLIVRTKLHKDFIFKFVKYFYCIVHIEYKKFLSSNLHEER